MLEKLDFVCVIRLLDEVMIMPVTIISPTLYWRNVFDCLVFLSVSR